MKPFLCLPLLIVSMQALANGNRVGNGGDVLTCKNAPSTLLDFFESSKVDKNVKGPHTEILRRVYQRLADRWPALGNQYLKRMNQIEESIEWTVAPLIDIKDSNELIMPPVDCTWVQAAIRRSSGSPLAKNFIFQKQTWDQLDELNKAGLLSHEIIYEHFSKLGESDSRKAREFNAFLFSSEMEGQTKYSLQKILEKYRLPVD